MGLTTFTPEKRVNPFEAQASELVAAYESGNTDAAWTEEVKTSKRRDGSSDGGRGAAILFQEAVSERGYTGRIRSLTENGDGTATVVLTVSPKHKPRVRKHAEADVIDLAFQAGEKSAKSAKK